MNESPASTPDQTPASPASSGSLLSERERQLVQSFWPQHTRGVEAVAQEWVEALRSGGPAELKKLASFGAISGLIREFGTPPDRIPKELREFERAVEQRVREISLLSEVEKQLVGPFGPLFMRGAEAVAREWLEAWQNGGEAALATVPSRLAVVALKAHGRTERSAGVIHEYHGFIIQIEWRFEELCGQKPTELLPITPAPSHLSDADQALVERYCAEMRLGVEAVAQRVAQEWKTSKETMPPFYELYWDLFGVFPLAPDAPAFLHEAMAFGNQVGLRGMLMRKEKRLLRMAQTKEDERTEEGVHRSSLPRG